MTSDQIQQGAIVRPIRNRDVEVMVLGRQGDVVFLANDRAGTKYGATFTVSELADNFEILVPDIGFPAGIDDTPQTLDFAFPDVLPECDHKHVIFDDTLLDIVKNGREKFGVR